MNVAKWFITTVLSYLEYCSAEMLISFFKVFILFIYGFCIFKNTAPKKIEMLHRQKMSQHATSLTAANLRKVHCHRKMLLTRQVFYTFFKDALLSNKHEPIKHVF